MRYLIWIMIAVGFWGTAQSVKAEESTEQSTEEPAAEAAPSKPVRKGKRIREKEAEGTEATDRGSETDTVIKSQYRLNGEPLEVDPD